MSSKKPHPADHEPVWRQPTDRRGWTTGPTACVTCGHEAVNVRCINCRSMESEATIAHGSFPGPIHSTRVKRVSS